MNNLFVRKTVLATILGVTAGQAMAAGDSVDIKVSGEFIPGACAVKFAGGGIVDYGTIKAETILKDDFTMLPVKNVRMDIECDGPMKIAFHVVDMREGSGVELGKIWDGRARGNSGYLGLGKSGDKNIGSWAMWLDPVDLDTTEGDGVVDPIYTQGSPTESTKWNSSELLWLAQTGDWYQSWAARGSKTPLPVNYLMGKLYVQAGINKGSELDLTKPITLDGMATIEVVYL